MWDKIKAHFKKYLLLYVSLMTFSIVGLITFLAMNKKAKEPETETEEETEAEETRAEITARLYRFLTDKGVSRSMALIIIAQAMHESGIYGSNLAKNYKNLFGMKQPQKRDTLSIGATPRGYASYASIEDSAADLLLWLQEFNAPDDFQSVQTYVSFLKSKGYFEDTLTNYMGAVTKHYNTIKYLS